MRDRFFSSFPRPPLSRWPAVVGAFVLWCAAAVVFAPWGTPLWPALAADAQVPLPAAEPLRFLFPKGEARLPLATGPYAFNQTETTNGQSLKRLFDLQRRLASLPLRPVWVVSQAGAVMNEQIRLLSTAIVGKAAGMGVDVPLLPKNGPLTIAASDPDFDVIEYRLEAIKQPPRTECAVMREVVLADMPTAVGGGPLRLQLAGGTVAATPGTVWRDIPVPGRHGEPGPWHMWSGLGVSAPPMGTTKEISEYPLSWNGQLKYDAMADCSTRLVMTNQ